MDAQPEDDVKVICHVVAKHAVQFVVSHCFYFKLEYFLGEQIKMSLEILTIIFIYGKINNYINIFKEQHKNILYQQPKLIILNYTIEPKEV